MTPAQIVHLRETLHERMRDLARERYVVERRMIEEECARIQMQCAESPGHLYAQVPGLGYECRQCVYCSADAPNERS